jgi:hypothetical protein
VIVKFLSANFLKKKRFSSMTLENLAVFVVMLAKA